MTATESWPPCYDGDHKIHPILPESDENPVLLFCQKCGRTGQATVLALAPMDDLPSDAIEQMAKDAKA